MKTFNYHSAKDVKEASKLASSNSAFLAGGMTTIPSMKLGLASYKDIIDIKRIKKLSGIKVSGKTVTIGATTKHSEVASSKDIKKAIPSLAALAEGIGDPQVMKIELKNLEPRDLMGAAEKIKKILKP